MEAILRSALRRSRPSTDPESQSSCTAVVLWKHIPKMREIPHRSSQLVLDLKTNQISHAIIKQGRSRGKTECSDKFFLCRDFAIPTVFKERLLVYFQIPEHTKAEWSECHIMSYLLNYLAPNIQLGNIAWLEVVFVGLRSIFCSTALALG